MKKLKLNLDDLQVESFEITPTAAGKGTVEGYSGYDCPSFREGPNGCITANGCPGGTGQCGSDSGDYTQYNYPTCHQECGNTEYCTRGGNDCNPTEGGAGCG